MKKLLVIIGLTTLLSGCATTTTALQQPLQKNARIAVVTTFSNSSTFKKVGTTVFNNDQYNHSIPGLNVNKTVHHALSREVRRLGRYRVIPIKGSFNPYSNMSDKYVISSGNNVSPEYKAYLSKLIKGKHIRYIILATDGLYNIDAGTGNWISMKGNGIFERSFLMLQRADAFSSYKLAIIETNNWQVIAKTSGQNSHNVAKDSFNKDFSKISYSSLKQAKFFINDQLKTDVVPGLRKLGL